MLVVNHQINHVLESNIEGRTGINGRRRPASLAGIN
jgi:hypothetical protein